MDTPQLLNLANAKVISLTDELALWQNVVTLLSDKYAPQFTALTTAQDEANRLAGEKNAAINEKEIAITDLTARAETAEARVTVLEESMPPVEVQEVAPVDKAPAEMNGPVFSYSEPIATP